LQNLNRNSLRSNRYRVTGVIDTDMCTPFTATIEDAVRMRMVQRS